MLRVKIESKLIFCIENFINDVVHCKLFWALHAQVWEGLNAVKTGRFMLGATDPKDSNPGTIRGDLCIQVGR